MAISNNTFISTLVKKILYGVTQTDAVGKEGPNEAIASPLQVFSDDIIAEGSLIPRPATGATTEVVYAHIGAERVKCRQDLSVAGSTTWFTVVDSTKGRDEEASPGVPNALIDWIPPSIDPSYLVKVYAGDPQTGGVLLNPLATNQEWIFDYVAGVLYFPNNVPSSVISNGVYIEGYRYIGKKGVSGGGGGSGVELIEESFTHTTSIINDGQWEDFEIETGTLAYLTELTVSSPCVIEAHSTSQRNDSNPYKFRAISSHLTDDGSYVIQNTRFYGPRYATLISKEDDKTYWRIINDSGSDVSFTLDLTVLKM